MNKNLVVLLVVVLLLGGGVWYVLNNQPAPTETEPVQVESSAQQTTMEQLTIEIIDGAFNPSTVTVKQGAEVTFVNNGTNAHTATADGGSFDTGLLEPGNSTSVVFSESGTFGYHCTPHPNMTGTIVVE